MNLIKPRGIYCSSWETDPHTRLAEVSTYITSTAERYGFKSISQLFLPLFYFNSIKTFFNNYFNNNLFFNVFKYMFQTLEQIKQIKVNFNDCSCPNNFCLVTLFIVNM